MLLILSEPVDEHVPFLLPTLEARGVDYLWLDPGTFPSDARLSVRIGSGGIAERSLQVGGQRYDLSTVTAVWSRRPNPPEAGPDVAEPSQREFVKLVSQRFLDGLWETLDCRWLPAGPATERAADNKLVQLVLAARLGFTIADTLLTNDPEAFLTFYNGRERPVVSKSLVNKDVERDGEHHLVLYTRPVARRDVVNYRSVRHAPVIFQDYVAKSVELRVTVVGSRVFAAEVGSQASHLTRHDWRHYDDPRIGFERHALPRDVEDRCVQLVSSLGLCFGAIDLILTPEGEYVFLEINPNGQWGFIELATGYPIGEAVTDLLLGPEESRGAP